MTDLCALAAPGAIISACLKYRYLLTRDLGMMGDGTCCFVMLNPSIADATINDPTVVRCMGYGRAWSCARLLVVNAFAYRSTDPQALYGMSKDAAIGPDNDQHIANACKSSRIVVCAWGNHGTLFGRAGEVLRIIRQHAQPMALKVNAKSGQPAHPLYLKANAQPEPYQ